MGEVTGEATRFDDAMVVVDGEEVRLADQSLSASYRHEVDDDDPEEYVVPVRWFGTRPREKAVWRRGMFANQHSACRLRNRCTLDVLAEGIRAAGLSRPGGDPSAGGVHPIGWLS